MSDPYGRVKGGKLSFKGESKGINKRKKKKQHIHKTVKAVEEEDQPDAVHESTENESGGGEGGGVGGGAEIYTIDAAKRMKYDELFPVEAKKFGYEPPKLKSVEDALDDRVKKKADRYCK